jgi:hypothetical protein
MNPAHAVFLSYASQDAAAAQHLCDALRKAGIEVWFDQSELRGGDTWDALIRRQIKSCSLFVPFISANTQSREEGYFRREWKLAVDRTSDMAGALHPEPLQYDNQALRPSSRNRTADAVPFGGDPPLKSTDMNVMRSHVPATRIR